MPRNVIFMMLQTTLSVVGSRWRAHIEGSVNAAIALDERADRQMRLC